MNAPIIPKFTTPCKRKRGRSGSAGEAVAAVTGTATLPNSAKAVNAGDVKAVTFVRDGTVVYACKIPGGAVVIIR